MKPLGASESPLCIGVIWSTPYLYKNTEMFIFVYVCVYKVPRGFVKLLCIGAL